MGVDVGVDVAVAVGVGVRVDVTVGDGVAEAVAVPVGLAVGRSVALGLGGGDVRVGRGPAHAPATSKTDPSMHKIFNHLRMFCLASFFTLSIWMIEFAPQIEN